MSTPSRLTFAVLADSHFHAEGPGAERQHGYPSDASFNTRNAAVVAAVQAALPAFVVHLGDVPHPVPGLQAHHGALAVARQTYDGLSMPLYMVPGNHDVGDKPHPWAPAPSVSVEKHAVFQAAWGPPWWSRDEGPLHLVGIDTPVLNSGLPLEDEQWAWLERDLSTASGRIMAFLHYPPFLLSPDEDEHYDNLAQPARARLLELFARHRVEAAFCGHVHHPFLHHHQGTAWYLLPSTAFVRPGFAELARVGPGDEHGRNDAGRLGWCLVHVDGDGHRVEWVRSEGATSPRSWAPGLAPGSGSQPELPLAVTLRHAWDAVADVPCDNLDPFRRKRARNDLALLAAVQLGATTLRLPLSDLRWPEPRARLLELSHLGLKVVLFTAEPVDEATADLLSWHADVVQAVELVWPRHLLDRPLPTLPVPRWLSVHGKAEARDDAYFSHFPVPGFAPGDPALSHLPVCEGLVIQVPPGVGPWEGVAAAVRAAGDRTPVAQVILPRGGEGVAFTDDGAQTRRVVEALLAARAFPQARVQLETFVDHDRGYYPRIGLVDRRGDPRPAWHALRHLARLLPQGARIQPDGDGRFLVEGLGVVELHGDLHGGDEGIDLVRGDRVRGPVLGPVLRGPEWTA